MERIARRAERMGREDLKNQLWLLDTFLRLKESA
jgi:hypothetical protein